MLTTSYLKLVHLTSKRCAAFQEACLLGSTWLHQRGLRSDIHAGGFGNFELSALIALLLEGGGQSGRSFLSDGYSSYQLWKATLQFLAKRDLSKGVFVIGPTDSAPEPAVDTASIVWDATRHHNLLYKMTSWSYELLRSEARTTINMLADETFEAFEASFIMRLDEPLYRYDYMLQLHSSNVQDKHFSRSHNLLLRYQKLFDVLKTGFGDRIRLINIISKQSPSWDVGFDGRIATSTDEMLVGFVVNPDSIHRTVDHGPSAEAKKEAIEFREFWGEKAELRRFKDGSILESLVWSSNDNGQSIFEQVVRCVLSKHFGPASEKTMSLVGDGFRKLLPQTSGTAGFHSLMEAYKELEADIRELDGLPLSVRQMMPSDSQLRYASIALPGSSHHKIPADVVIDFEGSNRWPDDLVAIQRTKIAFLLKINEKLEESGKSLISRIGLENQEHEILNRAFLDVVYDSGAAFRIRIHSDREQALLERQLKDKAVDSRSKEIAALALAKYKRDYIKTPLLTQAISRLCSRHTALSGTIRLVKKWFASHLLVNHIAEEVIEMLVARTFTQPWPWQAPSSVQTGFLRTLLGISRWDWHADPLVVDLSGSGALKQADVLAIKTKFEAWRQLDPALSRISLFCGSNVDTDGTAWTDGNPPKVVAARMTDLSKAASAVIAEKSLQVIFSSLFSSALNDFDFVLHLNPNVAAPSPHRNSASMNGYKNLDVDFAGEPSAVGYQPVEEFVQELNKLYGSSTLFFSAAHERRVIAGLWNPQTLSRDWKLNLSYSTIPKLGSNGKEVQAEINKEAILAEIARIGAGIVDKVEVKRPR